MTYAIALPKMIYATAPSRVPPPTPTPSATRRGVRLLALAMCVAVAGSLIINVAPAVNANTTAELIASVAPDQGSITRPNPRADGTFTATTEAGLFTLPASAADPLILTAHASAEPIALRLPGAAQASSPAVQTDDGTVVYAGVAGVDLAVQVLGDQGVRAQAVVRSVDAPRTFAYDFGTDVVGVVEPSGGVALHRATAMGIESVGRLAPPWARDATGRSVPTHYAVSGGVVTQHITPAPHHAYPLVADPFFIPVLGVVARFTVHALIRMAQRKISQEAVKRTIMTGVRTPGNQPGTSVFTRGTDKDRVRVVVNDRNGNIITVTK